MASNCPEKQTVGPAYAGPAARRPRTAQLLEGLGGLDRGTVLQ